VAVVLISDPPGEFGNVSQNNTFKCMLALIIDEKISFGEIS
jgi:hypothetical protein